MKKVYQTIHGRKDGNCLPAVIASLLELDIDDVPHFNKTPNWYESLSDFVFSKEHQIVSCFYNTEEAKLRGWGSYPAWYEKNKSLKNGLEMVNDYEGLMVCFTPPYTRPITMTQTTNIQPYMLSL